MRIPLAALATLIPPAPAGLFQPPRFDVVIRGGTVYDGAGGPGHRADVGVRGDMIAAIGNLADASATTVVNATGLAVAPGFINMRSWSTSRCSSTAGRRPRSAKA